MFSAICSILRDADPFGELRWNFTMAIISGIFSHVNNLVLRDVCFYCLFDLLHKCSHLIDIREDKSVS